MGVTAKTVTSSEQPAESNAERRPRRSRSLADILEHSLHFRLRVRIPLARSRLNSVAQHLLCFLDSIRLGQCLRRHEVPGRIIWIGGKQSAEFLERLIRLPGFGVFHRQSIAGKSIGWILRENLFEVFLASHQFIAFVSENLWFKTCRSHSGTHQEQAGPHPIFPRCGSRKNGKCGRRTFPVHLASGALANAPRPDRGPRVHGGPQRLCSETWLHSLSSRP